MSDFIIVHEDPKETFLLEDIGTEPDQEPKQEPEHETEQEPEHETEEKPKQTEQKPSSWMSWLW